MTATHNHGPCISAQIFEADYVICFDYRQTCKAYRATYDDPGSPAEYEVTFTSLHTDEGGGNIGPALECPKWLVDHCQWFLDESSDTQEVCDRDNEGREEYERDEAADFKRRQRRDDELTGG